MHVAGRLELGLSVFSPVVNCLEIPALFCHGKVGVKSLLLFIPSDCHDGDIGMAEERLPQIVKAVLVVPVAPALRVSLVVNGLRHIKNLLSNAILETQLAAVSSNAAPRGKNGVLGRPQDERETY